MFGVVDNAVARLHIAVRMLEKSHPELHGQYSAHTFVYPAFGYSALAHQLNHSRLPLRTVHVHVHSGHNALVKGLFVVGGSAMLVNAMLNIHPVAHNKSLESPFLSQHVSHQPAVGVARNAVQFVVRHHHVPISALLNGSLEGWEKHFAQGAFGYVAGCAVCSIDGIRAAHKVLYAAQHVLRIIQIALITLVGGHAHERNQIGVFAKGFATTAPTPIASHFNIGVEVPVHVHGTHFFGRLSGNFVGHVHIKR